MKLVRAMNLKLTTGIVEIVGNFSVWLISSEGAFLKGKFVWAQWDVEEMKAREKEITSNPHLLTFELSGVQI